MTTCLKLPYSSLAELREAVQTLNHFLRKSGERLYDCETLTVGRSIERFIRFNNKSIFIAIYQEDDQPIINSVNSAIYYFSK